MEEEVKVKKLIKVFDELCVLFPEGNLSLMVHKISLDSIPKELEVVREKYEEHDSSYLSCDYRPKNGTQGLLAIFIKDDENI